MPVQEKVTLLRCFGNKSHFEGEKKHDFTKFFFIELTTTIQKTSVSEALQNWSPTSCMLVGLSKNLSTVHLLYNTCDSNREGNHCGRRLIQMLTQCLQEGSRVNRMLNFCSFYLRRIQSMECFCPE